MEIKVLKHVYTLTVLMPEPDHHDYRDYYGVPPAAVYLDLDKLVEDMRLAYERGTGVLSSDVPKDVENRGDFPKDLKKLVELKLKKATSNRRKWDKFDRKYARWINAGSKPEDKPLAPDTTDPWYDLELDFVYRIARVPLR